MKLLQQFQAGHGRRFASFGLVGVFNTGVDFVAYSAAVLLGLAPAVANLLAFATANPLSYIINGRVTFRDAGGPAPLSPGGYAKFCTAHLLSLGLSTALVFWLSPFAGPFVAKLIAAALALFVNYFASAYLVYRTGEKTNSESPESP